LADNTRGFGGFTVYVKYGDSPHFLPRPHPPYPANMNQPIEDSTHVRLRFSRRGPARYLSHNSLVTVWERGFTRAGLDLSYSQGYSPKPVLRFGPPVPVGYLALAELLDVRLAGSVEPSEVVAGLNRSLPDGLAVTGAELLPGKPPSLMAAARSAGYEVRLDQPCGDLAERVAGLLALPELVVSIERGKRTRSADIRGATLTLEVASDEALSMRLQVGEGAACRPEDVLAALSLSAAEVTRTEIEYEFD
jgi:radical SAM-linked protein